MRNFNTRCYTMIYWLMKGWSLFDKSSKVFASDVAILLLNLQNLVITCAGKLFPETKQNKIMEQVKSYNSCLNLTGVKCRDTKESYIDSVSFRMKYIKRTSWIKNKIYTLILGSHFGMEVWPSLTASNFINFGGFLHWGYLQREEYEGRTQKRLYQFLLDSFF